MGISNSVIPNFDSESSTFLSLFKISSISLAVILGYFFSILLIIEFNLLL